MPLKFIQGMSLKKSATIVVKRLIDMCGAGKQYGRILFTDNFYTSLQLMIVLWISFKMFSVETFRITKKKARTIADFPFHKVSNGAFKKVNRGLMREEDRGIYKNGRLLFNVQATVWKDRKQVGFLHNHKVTKSVSTHTVSRLYQAKRRCIQVIAPFIQPIYAKYYSGVDILDRGISDWTCTVLTARYVNRFFLGMGCSDPLIILYCCYSINRSKTRMEEIQ